MTETILKGVTNIAFRPDGSLAVTSADPVPSNGTVRVSSIAELRVVLIGDVPDITIAPGVYDVTKPIQIYRIAERIIRAEPGAIIAGNGDDFRILSLPDGGTGGKLTITGLTIDGGWRNNKGECPDDSAANYFLPSLDYLLMENCITRYSRRTGIFATDTKKLIIRACTGFAMPRDFLWSNGSKDVLVEGCWVQHCGDDGIGSHVREGQSANGRSVIIRNNKLMDTLGIKVLGGGAQVLIEDNKIFAPGFYGVRLGIDPHTGEGRGAQNNITVRRNYIENVRETSPNHPDQNQGVWLFMHAEEDDRRKTKYPVKYVVIDGNKLVRNMADGDRLKSKYPWADQGSYAKSGFIDEGIKIGTEAMRYTCANPNDIIGNNERVGI